MKAIVCKQPDGLTKGDYAIQFEFLLPDELPSTLNFEENESIESPYLRTEYSITAILENSDDPSKALMTYHLPLIINQAPVPECDINAKDHIAEHPNFLYCFKLGTSKVMNELNKSNFQLGDNIESITTVDNSNSRIAAVQIKSWITQELVIILNEEAGDGGAPAGYEHSDEWHEEGEERTR